MIWDTKVEYALNLHWIINRNDSFNKSFPDPYHIVNSDLAVKYCQQKSSLMDQISYPNLSLFS